MKHLLEADSIQLDFGLRPILTDIHVQCATGNITGLLGRNGQGKSCLMRILYGDLPAGSSSIRFDGLTVDQPYKRPDLILYLPQHNCIPGHLSLARILKDFELDFGDLEKRFPEFGSFHRRPVRELSGGERRLIHIFIIVRSPTRFVLLDEPYTHLEPLQIEKVRDLLLEEKANKGMLITDHLYRDIMAISDWTYLLTEGKTRLLKNEEDIGRLGYARR